LRAFARGDLILEQEAGERNRNSQGHVDHDEELELRVVDCSRRCDTKSRHFRQIRPSAATNEHLSERNLRGSLENSDMRNSNGR
jgi:hypothetical protein